MIISKSDRYCRFTNIDKALMEDVRLSALQYKILTWSLSHNTSYTYHVETLIKQCREGRTAIYRALRGLESLGFLYRFQPRVNGDFFAVQYMFSDKTKSQSEWVKFASEIDWYQELNIPKQETGFFDRGACGFGASAQPYTKNNKEKNINTDISIKIDIKLVKKITPRPKKPFKPENIDTEAPEFIRFWEIYPKQEDIKGAAKAFTRFTCGKSEEWINFLLRKIENDISYRQSQGQWLNPNYVPLAKNYITDERWDDELPDMATASPQTPQGSFASQSMDNSWAAHLVPDLPQLVVSA